MKWAEAVTAAEQEMTAGKAAEARTAGAAVDKTSAVVAGSAEKAQALETTAEEHNKAPSVQAQTTEEEGLEAADTANKADKAEQADRADKAHRAVAKDDEKHSFSSSSSSGKALSVEPEAEEQDDAVDKADWAAAKHDKADMADKGDSADRGVVRDSVKHGGKKHSSKSESSPTDHPTAGAGHATPGTPGTLVGRCMLILSNPR